MHRGAGFLRERRLARVMKALSEPVRIAIVETLRGGERCVCDIAKAVGAERSNVSRHLSVLANAGVLTSRKQGLMIFYRLRTPCVLAIFDCVEGTLEEHQQELRAVPSLS